MTKLDKRIDLAIEASSSFKPDPVLLSSISGIVCNGRLDIVQIPSADMSILELINLEKPSNPQSICSIEVKSIHNICRGRSFFTCMYPKGDVSLGVLSNTVIAVLQSGHDGMPELIADTYVFSSANFNEH